MKNVFMCYMPPGNEEAMLHYRDTILNRVPLERVAPYVAPRVLAVLRETFGPMGVAVWGSSRGPQNLSRFERMQAGDYVLIVEGDVARLLGIVACKTRSSDLSRELWPQIRPDSVDGWELIYFIANPREINLPLRDVNELFGYSPDYRLRGFTSVAQSTLQGFYSAYDDLYSVLVRMKEGEVPERVREQQAAFVADREATDGLAGGAEEEITEHLKTQWELAVLGLKSGARIWVPRPDQGRITSRFSSMDFDESFTSGLDVQTKYVENIDTVWKEEFRIDAAFEIETSTAIYSGLLRFADLTTVAPNTIYPLFLVAPESRRSQVFAQLRRPAFKALCLSRKVGYLPCEEVHEVHDFFARREQGMSVELLKEKAELLTD